MSLKPILLYIARWRPTASGSAIPIQWSRSLPMRYSIVGSSLTLTITASAFAIGTTVQTNTSVCECESVSGGTSNHNIKCSPILSSRLHHHWKQDECPSRTDLASSPSPSPLIHALQMDQSANSKSRWQIKWWGRPKRKPTGQSSSSYSWWQRIGNTFFVITRGIEIVVRLSPLIVLTPTAVAVSYIDPILKRYIWKHKKLLTWNTSTHETKNNQQLIINQERTNNDEIFTTQFQQESNTLTRQITQHHNQQSSTWASNLAWNYTLHTLQCLGPAFVKLGQWAATRRDLFPVYMCNRLGLLHDTARIHAWDDTYKALVHAFGPEYESRGLIVDRDGIVGSGSAAQVHRGTLTLLDDDTTGYNKTTKVNTRTVAIKVLHPHTRELVERDLALMQHIADFIDTCIPLEMIKMLSLPRAVANFANIMNRQVDLRIEGNNLQTFRDNFGCSGYSNDGATSPAITFPCPETEWISEHVLVEEHAGDDAVPISRYLSDDSPEGLKVRKRLAGPLLRAFLKMVFIDNFIHVDLHPGNVLVRPVPNKRNPTRTEDHTIIFLDAGITTSLKPNDRQNLHDLYKAVVLNDGYTAGKLMVERARYERCTSVPGGEQAFANGVADIVAEFHDRRKQGLTLGAVRVGALLGQVLDLCRRFGVEIDPAMSSVVVSVLVLEGLGRSLDPDLNFIKAAIPFLIGRGKV